MREIRQQDILKYIHKRLGFRQNEMEDEIAELEGRTNYDYPKMNKAIKGTGNGYGDLHPDNIYRKFFAEKVSTASAESLEAMLADLKQFLLDEGVQFPEKDNLENADYKTFVMNMLAYGLPRFHHAKKETGNKTAPSEPAEKKDLRVPTLHSQNFYSIASFTGRDDVLKQMEELLHKEYTVVLSGIGGIGKTSLSNEYAKRHSSEYRQQQRIVCGNTLSSFRQMVLSLSFDGLNDAGNEEDAKFQERMKLLKHMDTSALLILDNIDKWPNDFRIFDELRADSKIHIIITTRLQKKFSPSYTIPVRVLEKEDQLRLFEHHLERPVAEKDLEVVNEILNYVDGHTLLIELIAKSISTGALEYSEMLDALRSGANTDELPAIQIQKDTYNEENQMWPFILETLFNIEPLSNGERDTLRHLVLLPTEGISRILFKKLSPQLFLFLTSLETKSWSIRENTDTTVITKLHPVIREVVKAKDPPTSSNCRAFLEQMCQVLNSSKAPTFTEDLCKLVQNVIHTIDFMEEPSADNLRLLLDMARFYQSKKEYSYQNTLEIYSRALELLDACGQHSFPPQEAVDAYCQAGRCCQQLAKYEDAISHYKMAIDIAPAGSLLLAKAYRGLGEVFRKNSDYPEALRYDHLALELFSENYDIAEVLNAIGVIYINMNNPHEAKKYYSEARDKWVACCGPQQPENIYKQLAYVNHNIGTVCYQLNEFSEAEAQHLEGLRLREEHSFFEGTRDIASSHIWLGKDYIALGSKMKEKGREHKAAEYMEMAKLHIEKSLSIRKELLGESHPDYAWSLDTLSYWYEENGDIDSAIRNMKMVINIRRTVLGSTHKYTQDALERYNALQKKV